jgi:large subunit ribosomal protein L16
MLYEMEGVDEINARAALKLAQYKLPVPTKIIARSEMP